MVLNETEGLWRNLGAGFGDVLQAEVVGLAALFVELLQGKISRVPDRRVIHVICCGTVWTLVQYGRSRNCAWKSARPKVDGNSELERAAAFGFHLPSRRAQA